MKLIKFMLNTTNQLLPKYKLTIKSLKFETWYPFFKLKRLYYICIIRAMSPPKTCLGPDKESLITPAGSSYQHSNCL
ncbi:hypothetical protein HanIR_Chr01g0009251 [Helianthus annuus]|nr:hypothetical protein HanIR_Chr01g0009251 [Helianthus annuus]